MHWENYIRAALICGLSALAVIIMIPVCMRIAMEGYMYTTAADVPRTQLAVVLGASVIHGKPSQILEERAAAAVELYRLHKVSKILVTGDNGALSHDEVTPVRKYLINAGIPAKDIFLDHAGFDTYSSMYRARDVFQAQSVTIVTQDFHLPRAVFIARHLGMEAYGFTAAGGDEGHDYIREIPASNKALLDLFIRRIPKYLGEVIPLNGDGSTTWY